MVIEINLSMKYTLLLIALFLQCTCLTAQEFYFKNLSKRDGLSNNYIKDMVQDRQGFIWIATEAGLNRFDGKNITTYNTLNSDLNNATINALLYDEKENQLWIGTNANLSILDCSTLEFHNYKDFDGIPLINIVHLAHGANDDIWITNFHQGVIQYNRETKKVDYYSSNTINEFINFNRCTYTDGKGNLYIGHAQNGFSILNLSDHTLRHFRHDPSNPKSLPGNYVYTIKEDQQGNLWLGTNQGLALFNPRREEFIVFQHNDKNPTSLIGNQITDIKEMKDGSLWISADIGGISILDLYDLNPSQPQKVEFTNISSDEGLSSGNTHCLMQDSFGNIWVGSVSNGVDVISHIPPAFHILPYTTFNGKEIKNIPTWGVYADDKHQVWVGCENKVALFNSNQLKKTFDITTYRGKYPSSVFSITGDSHGNIFLGMMKDGLIKLDKENNKFQRISFQSEELDVISFFEDEDSKIWIGTHAGLFIYKDGEITKQQVITDQLPSKSIFGICRDHQGKLWVGTFGSGIFAFNKNNELVTELSLQKGFFSNAVTQLYLDSEGCLWISSRNNGVAYIKDTNKPEDYKQYSVEQGLNDLFVRAMQEDKSGNMWFSTNGGISLWNRATDKIDNYDENDGVPVGNFIDGSATLNKEDGTIYFGSLDGVCYFNPEKIMVEHSIAPVQIVECKVFSTKVESEDKDSFIPAINGNLDLKHYQNSFRISFSVPDYAFNKQIEYAYQIEGLQDVWSNTAGDNEVTFRNIPSGNYVFKVKARLRNQDWEEKQIASLKIKIQPPLWLAWYAKLFYALLLCLGVYFLIRSYKHKLQLRSLWQIELMNNQNEKKLNEERLRFYTNITHELRTPLTLILGPLEDLKNDQNLPTAYNNKISTIHASAIRLLNLISQILEFRKTETQNRELIVSKGDIANLITEVGLHYMELNQNPKLQFHINIDTNRTILYYDTEVITVILNNLLSNAVKYTPEGDINLSLSSVPESGYDYTEIRVSDTGYGIEAETIPKIFDRYYQTKGKHQASGTGIGLSIVKSLTDLHQGDIRVESQPGQGTSFILRLDTNNTYPTALHSENELKAVESATETEDIKEPQEADSLSILVVEDNKEIRQYITSSFSEKYIVMTAENGKEGLHLAQEKIPNIIISDIMMPEMDGIELCRLVKDDIRTSHIPVILLTAKDSIYDKEIGYESGADSYITKPFSINLIKRRIQNLLENRQRTAKQIIVGNPEAIDSVDSIMNNLDKQFLNKLTALIKDNITMPQLDVPFLRSEMNMSYISFYRKTKALTGLSPNEFIRKIRLKNSTELLVAGPYNISEVAYMTGFNDLNYFRQCFKDEYNMTPSEYIKRSNK